MGVDFVQWLIENLGSIVVVLVLIAIVSAIIVHMIRQKRPGRGGCGWGCDGCANSGYCHPRK